MKLHEFHSNLDSILNDIEYWSLDRYQQKWLSIIPFRVEIHSLDDPKFYDDTNYPHEFTGKWSVSRDGEHYYGCFNSPEEAANEGSQYIGRCVRPPVLAAIDVERIIEDIQCQDFWLIDAAEGALNPSRKQMGDLEKRIKECVSHWLTEHNLWPMFCLIEDAVDLDHAKGVDQ